MQDIEKVFCGLFVNVGYVIHICKLHDKVFCIVSSIFIIFSIRCFGKKDRALRSRVFAVVFSLFKLSDVFTKL